MAFNPYLYEKLIAARHSQIRHEVQQSRELAHAGQRRTLARYAVGRFGSWLGELGSRLKRTEQQDKESLWQPEG